jgi:hypothetical protein
MPNSVFMALLMDHGINMWSKINKYAALINMILLALLTIGYFFGAGDQKIISMSKEINEVKSDVKEIRTMMFNHIERGK